MTREKDLESREDIKATVKGEVCYLMPERVGWGARLVLFIVFPSEWL